MNIDTTDVRQYETCKTYQLLFCNSHFLFESWYFYRGVGNPFFYPGSYPGRYSEVPADRADTSEVPENVAVTMSEETLCADTEYVLKETDILRNTSVETSWQIPHKYIGMTRERFLETMNLYAEHPPLSELERGFVGLEVLSFSREKVVVRMDYRYLQPSDGFYLAVRDNEVVVYLEDRSTIYINTGIALDSLPEKIQMQVMDMLSIPDEKTLYDFLETYSS